MRKLNDTDFLNGIGTLRGEQRQLDFAIDVLLEKRGWKCRCNFPDDVWRYCKYIHCQCITVNQADAVCIEMNLITFAERKVKHAHKRTNRR